VELAGAIAELARRCCLGGHGATAKQADIAATLAAN
jgi:hypothetical protein